MRTGGSLASPSKHADTCLPNLQRLNISKDIRKPHDIFDEIKDDFEDLSKVDATSGVLVFKHARICRHKAANQASDPPALEFLELAFNAEANKPFLKKFGHICKMISHLDGLMVDGLTPCSLLHSDIENMRAKLASELDFLCNWQMSQWKNQFLVPSNVVVTVSDIETSMCFCVLH